MAGAAAGEEGAEVAVEAGEEVAHGVDVGSGDRSGRGGCLEGNRSSSVGGRGGEGRRSGGGRSLKRIGLRARVAGKGWRKGAGGARRNVCAAALNERGAGAASGEGDHEDAPTLAPRAGRHHDPGSAAAGQTDDARGCI